MLAAEPAESVIRPAALRFGILWRLESNFVVRFELQVSLAILDRPLKHKAGKPLHFAGELHDHLFKGRACRLAGIAHDALVFAVLTARFTHLVAVIRNCQDKLATVDGHKLLRVIHGVDIPSHIVPEAHEEPCAVACDGIRVSAALQRQMDIAIATPRHPEPRVEVEPNLVPETDLIGGVELRFRHGLDRHHHILNRRLVRRTPGDTGRVGGVNVNTHV